MFRATTFLSAKTLADMLRRFRVAGAHPDVIYSIDADKAKNNGDEFIRLEEVLSVREMGRQSPQYDAIIPRPHSFVFWIQTPEWHAYKEKANLMSSSSSVDSLRRPINPLAPVQCTLTPNASDAVVKQQLKELFKQVNIDEDFTLRSNKAADQEWGSLQGAFHAAGDRHYAFTSNSRQLFQQADALIDKLRQMGTFIVCNIDRNSMLVTLPMLDHVPSQYRKERTGYTGAILINPADMTNDAMRFIDERGLKPFDIQAAGSEGAVRQFLFAFDKLNTIFTLNRGKALRSEVTIVIDTKGDKNFVAYDDTIVLGITRMAQWEEFLLGINQATWQRLVERHRQWMTPASTIVADRKRKLARVADSLGVFGAVLDNTFGTDDGIWQQQLLLRLAADEGLIRKTIEKYNIKDANAKKRVMLHFSNRLASAANESLDYRIGSTGHIFFHAKATTPQMLKVLRSNLGFAAAKSLTYDKMLSRLSRVAQLLHVNMSIDESLKRNRDATLIEDMASFTTMLEKHLQELSAFTRRGGSAAVSSTVGGGVTAMNWVISERFDVSQSGTVYLPFDIDFKTLKQHLLK